MAAFHMLFVVIFAVLLAEAFGSAVNLTAKHCPPGQLFIDDEVHPGCYAKARLEEPCHFDVQCNHRIPYTFCGWDTDDLTQPKCQCVDGFAPTKDNQCHPMDRCSLSEYNTGLLQADCDENQFCRNGYCLCKPGYAYDQEEESCLLLKPESSLNQILRVSQLNDRIENADYKKTVSELVKLKRSLQWTHYVIAAMLVAIIAVVSVFLGLLMAVKNHFADKRREIRHVEMQSMLNRKANTAGERLSTANNDTPPPYNLL